MSGFFSDVNMHEFGSSANNPSERHTVQNNAASAISKAADGALSKKLERPSESTSGKLSAQEETKCEFVDKLDFRATAQTMCPEEQTKKSNPFGDTKKDAPSTPTKNENSSTVISIGTVIEGNVTTEGGISIDGKIIGNVNAGSVVAISRHGVVEGNVKGNGKITVTGQVAGDVSGADVVLDKTRIKGNILSSGLVQIGSGAVVIGSVSAQNASICGAVNGDIDVKGHVRLESKAIVKGNIQSKSVEIASGAAIDGVCKQSYADVSPASFFENLSTD